MSPSECFRNKGIIDELWRNPELHTPQHGPGYLRKVDGLDEEFTTNTGANTGAICTIKTGPSETGPPSLYGLATFYNGKTVADFRSKSEGTPTTCQYLKPWRVWGSYLKMLSSRR